MPSRVSYDATAPELEAATRDLRPFVLDAGKLEAAKRAARASAPAAQRGGRAGMNANERAYAEHLDTLKACGVVSAWWYEGLTLLLGDGCRHTPDFLVELPTGELELRECKAPAKGGATYRIEEDARVKSRTCARLYPFRYVIVWRVGVEWRREVIDS